MHTEGERLGFLIAGLRLCILEHNVNTLRLSAALYCVLLATSLTVCGAEANPKMDEKALAGQIVCVGDSGTDGYTYGQVLMQALKEAGKSVPAVICAGVGGDTASAMAARLDRDALRFNPTLITFNAGHNDASRGLGVEQYEAAIRQVSEKCKARGIPLVLMTPCPILGSPALKAKAAEPNADARTIKAFADANAKALADEAMMAKFDVVLRKVAQEYGWAVAETNKILNQDRDKVMSSDGRHPNYYGQSLMARSILDAIGYSDVPLPKRFDPKLFPGVIAQWKIRAGPLGDGNKPAWLTPETAAALTPDDTWKDYTLPDPAPTPAASVEEWAEQSRVNGFGRKVQQVLAGMPQASTQPSKTPAKLVQALAVIDSPTEKKVWINTGIGVMRVWLNGQKVHEQPGAVAGNALWTGYHAGKERIEATLQPGKNTMILEIDGGEFFLSVTDKLIWEKDLR